MRAGDEIEKGRRPPRGEDFSHAFAPCFGIATSRTTTPPGFPVDPVAPALLVDRCESAGRLRAWG